MQDDPNEIANILKEAGVENVKEQTEDDILAELGFGKPKPKPGAAQPKTNAKPGLATKVTTDLSDEALLAELDDMEEPLDKAKRLTKEIEDLHNECKELV